MSQAEPKVCPRCQAPFECKVGNIPECQCNGIRLTADARTYIATNYTDCLCRTCLLAISSSKETPDPSAA